MRSPYSRRSRGRWGANEKQEHPSLALHGTAQPQERKSRLNQVEGPSTSNGKKKKKKRIKTMQISRNEDHKEGGSDDFETLPIIKHAVEICAAALGLDGVG